MAVIAMAWWAAVAGAAVICPATHPLAAWDDFDIVFVGRVVKAAPRRWTLEVQEPLGEYSQEFLKAGRRVSVRIRGDGPPPIAQQVDELAGATGLFYLRGLKRPWFGFCNPSFAERFPYSGRSDFEGLDHGVDLVADFYRHLPGIQDAARQTQRDRTSERPWAYRGVEGFPWPMNPDPVRPLPEGDTERDP